MSLINPKLVDVTRYAKGVLDVCAYELREVPIWAQANLESAICRQMELALNDALSKLNKPNSDAAHNRGHKAKTR